ncbi:hypothetical protein FW320_13835 [Azospirillum sp. Vi22]|uniref:trypsin-like peptidase domain-containing protein n=1 Tax=Azospirillum baldaniorum TaxID=1064539 RepID=UPI00157ACF44|nr:trypsin-like peptidase domain-containing protein [Azospirillum baldaniorum]NUB07253.1 hypothetical protein [Azospirillum baldaniorum]
MVVKMLYSLVLCGIIWLLTREVFQVWFDKALYVGPFEYAGGTGADQGKNFGIEVAHAHMLLYRQLQNYTSRRGGVAVSDKTFILGNADRLNLPANTLGEVTLTYQNVDLGKLLTSLRKGLRQPNEVSGFVIEGDGMVQAAVEWPRAPAVGRTATAETAFTTEPRKTLSEAARLVACGIAWPQLASRSDGVSDLGRTGFCRWAEALAVHASMSVQAAGGVAVDTNGQEQVTRAITRLTGLIASGATYPELYRLRADLVDLLPAEKAMPLQVQAQDDRLRYAIATRDDLQRLPEADRKQVAFAIARPALAVNGGKFRDALPDNWKSLLEGRTAVIAQSIAATGFLGRGQGPQHLATAFRIAPDLIVTVDFALGQLPKPPEAEAAPANAPDPRIHDLHFCEAEDARTACPPDRRSPVTAIVFDGTGYHSRVMVLRIEEAEGPPPRALSLRSADGDFAQAVTDRYAVVVGYPARDQRMPTAVVQTLLGQESGIKRVMPGRMLGLGNTEMLTGPGIVTDINTTGGVAGGPLIDLTTGRVVGVHVGGQWKEGEGKFAYSAPFTDELLALIDQAIKARIAGAARKPTP